MDTLKSVSMSFSHVKEEYYEDKQYGWMFMLVVLIVCASTALQGLLQIMLECHHQRD